MYYIIIQNGDVFEGTLKRFKETFFTFPKDWSEEMIIIHIRDWVQDNGWIIEFKVLN